MQYNVQYTVLRMVSICLYGIIFYCLILCLILFKANYTIMYEYIFNEECEIVTKYFFQIVIYVCMLLHNYKNFLRKISTTQNIFFYFSLYLFYADYYKDYYSFILQNQKVRSFVY